MDWAITSNCRTGSYLCWSRIQAEAGQSLEQIISRKERERLAGNGIFYWGVGNPPAVAIRYLARVGSEVPVVFSLMKSQPRVKDLFPDRIAIWRRYIDIDGMERALPEHVLVTSKIRASSPPRNVHYALVCRSEAPLRLQRGILFDHRAYRNVSIRNARVAPSQVTALLEATGEPAGRGDYEENLRARLVGGNWVRLTDAIVWSPNILKELSGCANLTPDEWGSFVRSLRYSNVGAADYAEPQMRIF